MRESRKLWTLGIGLLCVVWGFCTPPQLFAQRDLQYQKRGDRYEGIKPKPVSGYDIELISVLADYQELLKGDDFPNRVMLRFYLPHKTGTVTRA